ncbi:hypothetical protein A8U91_03926 [Halomonas elongata]|uniref:Uncharacterized protein n=1 Tax=Halomonas elongata TaxID=2746 RepID=A0A1B8NY24_HALEL|nr:hypothetical protein [Halomonas elongata]OBX34863.1 hypothetical protein A8U91_03926 [Halomonas elongata]
MTPIDTNYLRDLGRIQQARSCGAQALEETPAWRAAERIDELEQKNRELHMQYAGAMGLISEMSGHLALNHPSTGNRCATRSFRPLRTGASSVDGQAAWSVTSWSWIRQSKEVPHDNAAPPR